MEVKVCCQAKDCTKTNTIEWNGGWIEKWYCDEHTKIREGESNTKKETS